jgi:phosphoinositide 3-/4-kinase-like protein
MLALAAALLLLLPPTQDAAPASANVWNGREAEFENCLRTAKVLKVEEVPIGVTKPKRAFTEPGSICESFAWKVLPPGMHKGFWDSYKSEIAAYELDKMVGLGMVPPIVERDVQHQRGAAVLWLKGVKSWEEALRAPNKGPNWIRDVVRMKMWDNLVGNTDRNKGNILVDGAGNIFLIDHSRAFITEKKLPQKLETYVDRELWQRMQALTFESLKEKIGAWVGGSEIRAMLARRDRMQKEIDALVAVRGEHVYVK